jgi:transcriptional regulator with PAS, ATPase and Fis domain
MQKPIWSRDQDGKDEETPDPSKSRISSRCPSKAALAALLTEHEGNNTRIADVLGVGRTQVKRWVEHHGLNRLDFVKKKP